MTTDVPSSWCRAGLRIWSRAAVVLLLSIAAPLVAEARPPSVPPDAPTPTTSGTVARNARPAASTQRGGLERRLSKERSTHFTVLFEGPSDELIARRVVEYLEAIYLRIGEALRTYPAEPITVILYTLEQFTDATRLPEWTIAAYDGRIHLPVRGAPQQGERLDRVLSHEFVHAVVATLAGRRAPTWLDEGLATTLQRGGADNLEAVLTATTTRPRLSELHEGFIKLDARDAQVAYALSARAVRRMIQMRGTPAIVALLRDLGRGTPFDPAFNRHMAIPYEDFQAALAR